MASIDPTIRRQELGAELRILRKKAHFTLEQASGLGSPVAAGAIVGVGAGVVAGQGFQPVARSGSVAL